MKSYLLFVLLFIMNCDMSTTTKFDYDKISLLLLTVNNNTTINNNSSRPGISNGGNGGTYFSSCGLDCVETHSNYWFDDYRSDGYYCMNDPWPSGNNNGRPDLGEKGVLQIPLIYNGDSPLPKIKAELIPEDSRITIFGWKEMYYPELRAPSGKDVYFSCIDTYFEEWSKLEGNLVCNKDSRHQCLGWKIQIPYNFTGYVDFKLLLTSKAGSKVLKYRL